MKNVGVIGDHIPRNTVQKDGTPFLKGIDVDLNGRMWSEKNFRKFIRDFQKGSHTIEITDDEAGYLLGFCGKRIRSITDSLGEETKINVSPKNPKSNQRYVKISGRDIVTGVAKVMVEIQRKRSRSM